MSLPLTNLTFHCNASVDTDMWVNSQGGSPYHNTQASDGQNIQVWDDVEHGVNILYSSPAPSYSVNTPLMLLPCVVYNGSNTYSFLSDDITNTAQSMSVVMGASAKTLCFSIYVSAVGTNQTGANAYLNDQLLASNYYFGIGLRDNGSATADLNGISSQYKIIAWNDSGTMEQRELSISLNTSYVVCVVHDGTNLTISLDNGTPRSIASGATGDVTGSLKIAHGYPGSGYAGVRIGEIAFYDAALTGTPLSDLKAAFTSVWLPPASITITPTVGALTSTGIVPTALTSLSRVPTVGALTSTGLNPTVTSSTSTNITPTVGSLVFVGILATVTTPVTVSPSVGALTLVGIASTVVGPHSRTPAVGALALTGIAPTVTNAVVLLNVVHKVIVQGGAVATITTGSPLSTTSGNLLHATGAWNSGYGATFTSITDTAANTWATANAVTGNISGSTMVQKYAENCIGSAFHYFVLTLSVNGYPTLSVIEIGGVKLTGALDQIGSHGEQTPDSPGTTHSVSADGATSQNAEIVVGAICDGVFVTSFVTDATYTAQNNLPCASTGLLVATKILSSTGTPSFAPTTTANSLAMLMLATYKQSSSGDTVTITPTVGSLAFTGYPPPPTTSATITPSVRSLGLTGTTAGVTTFVRTCLFYRGRNNV